MDPKFLKNHHTRWNKLRAMEDNIKKEKEGNNMRTNFKTSQKEMNCNHVWESKPGGFTPEGGFWNYSQCIICGETTTDYDHGDFQGKLKEEQDQQNQ